MKTRYVSIIFILIAFILFGSGKILDLEAERYVKQLYARNDEGVINGLEPIVIKDKHKRAVVLFHGFMQSPDVYTALVNDIKSNVRADIYVPLFPFHGRDLQTATNLNSKEVVSYAKDYIDNLAKQYESVILIGFSYGGAVLVDLAGKNQLPENTKLILYAPAIFIKTNTMTGFWEAKIYTLWRNYCNYQILGCGFPAYYSGDAVAKPQFDHEKSFRYDIIPSILQMYSLDIENRETLSNMSKQYALIIAEDDNRVSYKSQLAACESNKSHCQMYSFPSGHHLLHWGANKAEFERLLIKLINEPLLPAVSNRSTSSNR